MHCTAEGLKEPGELCQISMEIRHAGPVSSPSKRSLYRSILVRSSMPVTLPLSEMSVVEKLRLMEEIWEDLRRNSDAIESPAWHEEVLKETLEQQIASGEARFVDWEQTKAEITASGCHENQKSSTGPRMTSLTDSNFMRIRHLDSVHIFLIPCSRTSIRSYFTPACIASCIDGIVQSRAGFRTRFIARVEDGVIRVFAVIDYRRSRNWIRRRLRRP